MVAKNRDWEFDYPMGFDAGETAVRSVPLTSGDNNGIICCPGPIVCQVLDSTMYDGAIWKA